MEDINLLSWNYKDTPEEFNAMIKRDFSYFENLMLNSNIKNFIILITCNRVEIYFRGDLKPDKNVSYVKYPNSIKHLFYVSSGLESMLIGENNILKQIKDSLEIARKRGSSDKFLDFAFQKALSLGKSVRTKTDISRGKTSLSSIGLDLINKNYGLQKKICIIGTGKMAESLLSYLKDEKGDVTVAGRNIDHARNLAMDYGANYIDLSNILSLVDNHDIIITATSSKKYIIDKNMVEKINGKKIFLDISNPPNIEKIERDDLKILNLESIKEVAEDTIKQRKEEIKKSENIIKNELNLFMKKINEMHSDDIISYFYKFARNIKNNEILELKRKINPDDEQLKYINLMMNSFINKILAPYTNSVKSFIDNNDRYSYILGEYEKMLNNDMGKSEKKKIKERN